MVSVTIDQALRGAVEQLEQHAAAAGWDHPPMIFALVRAGDFSAQDPSAARRLGTDRLPADTLVPVEQDALPDGPLDEALSGIAWPPAVAGCALCHEIVVLPPAAEAALADLSATDLVGAATAHPDRREARLVVGVLRDGAHFALLRLRGQVQDGTAKDGTAGNDDVDDIVTGDDLAPNLVAALLTTLED